MNRKITALVAAVLSVIVIVSVALNNERLHITYIELESPDSINIIFLTKNAKC